MDERFLQTTLFRRTRVRLSHGIGGGHALRTHIRLSRGGGILVTACRGLQNGVLQASAYFFRKEGYRPTRAQEPVAFYFFAIVYIAGGIALLLYGLGVLTGQLTPLPLN